MGRQLSFGRPRRVRAYRARFPEIDRIPTFRGSAVGAIDAELAISLEPDVVILNLSSRAAVSSGLMTHLARAGIAVVFVDFRTRMFDNTTRSIESWASCWGARTRARVPGVPSRAVGARQRRAGGRRRPASVMIERARPASTMTAA